MSPPRLYLLHPPDPFFEQCIEEVASLLVEEPSWEGWSLRSQPYDCRGYFSSNEVLGWVHSVRGPVVLLERVQRGPYDLLRQALEHVVPVLLRSITCSEDLIFEVIPKAQQHFLAGKPLLPVKFVLAVLVVRKLIHGNYWTGREKGYLWARDLPNGGIPKGWEHKVPEVAHDLLCKDILVSKVSCGKNKYALNPQRKREIHDISEKCHFQNESLYRVLLKDKEVISARELDR